MGGMLYLSMRVLEASLGWRQADLRLGFVY